MDYSNKILQKLITLTNGKQIQWVPFHNYNDDPNNPYMFHQHFVPKLSYRCQVTDGTFYLISFRCLPQFPDYLEQLVLCFVSNTSQELINESSSELIELRKDIEKLFLITKKDDKKATLESISDELNSFLNS